MTPNEASGLLAICASFDNRQPNPEAAQAWAAALDGYPFADCRDAVIAHYRKTSEWIMPAHVIAAVKPIRAKRIAEANDQLVPPPGLTEAQERAWLGQARRRIGNGELLEVVSPRPVTDKRHLELAGPATVETATATAVRSLRAAHAEARRDLQEALAAERADREARRQARAEARRRDYEARHPRAEVQPTRERTDQPEEGDMHETETGLSTTKGGQ